MYLELRTGENSFLSPEFLPQKSKTFSPKEILLIKRKKDYVIITTRHTLINGK